ncbi:hypothetical protein CYMTET_8951 [Cymbomonas tetramitiformis]|uniref:BCAS3 WD40 domain-containing protein n=1 Tax=Cymbomonas tetramitiformis TaxID=36881 RepID=A0AAE0GSH4_9CHLO|nr:hypothetical protein CYMTET_8951 [Cymbomonas tetramitiformis]
MTTGRLQNGIGALSTTVRANLPQFSPLRRDANMPLDANSDRREQVLSLNYDTLEINDESRRVLCLTYRTGFQVWDVQDPGSIRELVSRRDGPASGVRAPRAPDSQDLDSPLYGAQAVLAIYGPDHSQGENVAESRRENLRERDLAGPSAVRFYSLQSHAYLHKLRFRTRIVSVSCSRRFLAVALPSLIFLFDTATFENVLTLKTYPTQLAPGTFSPLGPFALGARWIAYASNEPPTLPNKDGSMRSRDQ